MADQTYATHRRFLPSWHFFALPVLVANVVVVALQFYHEPRGLAAWNVIVAIALVTAIFKSRSMPLRAQDRIIRLEERLRLERVLPADLRARIPELSPSQLIGLRFAPDDEVPELTRRTLNGELKTATDIKRAVATWRADHMRV